MPYICVKPYYHMYKLSACFLLMLCLGLSSCKKAKTAAPSLGSCAGIITDESGKPIVEASVNINSIHGTLKYTDTNGKYLLENLPVGEVIVSVSAPDYVLQVLPVNIISNQVAALNFKLKKGPNTLSVSLNSMPLLPKALNFEFNLSSNTDWTISGMPDWVTFSELSGHGNKVVTIKATENTTDSIRDAILYFSTGTVFKEVVLRQAAPVKLIGQPDDISIVKDSIALGFNQAVTLVKFTDKSTFCHGDNSFSYFDSNKGIKIHYGCGSIGKANPLNVLVKDVLGFETSIDFAAKR